MSAQNAPSVQSLLHEALTQRGRQVCEGDEDGILLRVSEVERLQRELDAARANERRAFELGWRTAANWMERDDLHADIGSPCYIADREAALAAQEGK